jgi:hypothetical protein
MPRPQCGQCSAVRLALLESNILVTLRADQRWQCPSRCSLPAWRSDHTDSSYAYVTAGRLNLERLKDYMRVAAVNSASDPIDGERHQVGPFAGDVVVGVRGDDQRCVAVSGKVALVVLPRPVDGVVGMVCVPAPASAVSTTAGTSGRDASDSSRAPAAASIMVAPLPSPSMGGRSLGSSARARFDPSTWTIPAIRFGWRRSNAR